jgi:hypothetical protein
MMFLYLGSMNLNLNRKANMNILLGITTFFAGLSTLQNDLAIIDEFLASKMNLHDHLVCSGGGRSERE